MGRRGCNISEMTAFLHTCTFCNLEDMSATGVKYTWTNGRRGESNVKKRLDRFLANPDWLELHPGASFQNLARIASDHSPIICRLVPLVKKKKKIFRFENMWLRDETIHEVVREAWASSLANGLEHDPCAIVKECAVKLTHWNNTSFGHVQRSIKSKKGPLRYCSVVLMPQHGDGCNVNVWEDFWLANHRRLGPKPDGSEVVYVRDLLNDAGDDWNRELVVSLFPHDIANKIFCCFVSQSSPDTIYWLNSSHGQFSCKTAYFLALDMFEEIEQNDTEGPIKLWSAIWKANVPNKIKLFIWWALRNYVPTAENMLIRRLTLSSASCTCCGQLGEDVMHILYRCSAAKEVWVRCSLDRLFEENEPDTLEDLCHVILEKNPSSWEIFIMILWGLWTRRNERFHGQLHGRERQVDVVAKHLLSEYQVAVKKNLATISNEIKETRSVVWEKPQPEQVKFNSDASWQKETSRASLGFVARNHNGDVLLSGVRVECYAVSPLEAEAKAIMWAMTHARNRNFQNVVFESDSLSLVNALRNRSTLRQIACLFS
ncbi:hypothetical protein CTI12_AA315820 [Artemisia annua]|uniref:Reverse transcriptase n=1 Tax=Artemisia annua TaxID=35608 RepID=A0A2U1MVM0_ARTAN|nr:hypothetical protein CTI12_AA315820 [Artemisia annua]